MTATPNTVPKDSGEWFSWVQSRLRVLERHRHTGSIDNELTALHTEAEVISSWATNFSLSGTGVNFLTDGTMAMLDVAILRSVSAVTGPADGNIGNVSMGYVLPQWAPAITSALCITGYGPITSGYIDTAGQLVVSAIGPGNTWPAGLVCSFAATYFLQSVLDTDVYT